MYEKLSIIYFKYKNYWKVVSEGNFCICITKILVIFDNLSFTW